MAECARGAASGVGAGSLEAGDATCVGCMCAWSGCVTAGATSGVDTAGGVDAIASTAAGAAIAGVTGDATMGAGVTGTLAATAGVERAPNTMPTAAASAATPMSVSTAPAIHVACERRAGAVATGVARLGTDGGEELVIGATEMLGSLGRGAALRGIGAGVGVTLAAGIVA